MGGQSNAFGAVPLTRDEQSFFFPASRFFFSLHLCVFLSMFRAACLGCFLRGRPAHRPPPPRTHQLLLTRRRRRRAKGTARQLSTGAKSA